MPVPMYIVVYARLFRIFVAMFVSNQHVLEVSHIVVKALRTLWTLRLSPNSDMRTQ